MDDYDKVDKATRDRGVKIGIIKAMYRSLVGMYFLPLGNKLEKAVAVYGNVILITICCLATYTMMINIDFLDILFEACFLSVAIAGVELAVLNGLIYLGNVSRMLYIVGTDCYVYENEETTASEINDNIQFNIYIKKLTTTYKWFMFTGIGSHVVLTPFIQSDDTLGNYNRNLLVMLYLPIETDESNIGYFLATVLYLVGGWFMYLGVIGLDLGCYTMLLHLEHQLRILNGKVKCLEVRAMRRMGIKESAINKYKGRLWDNKEFNQNMWLCLRENIRHHQNIIRFYNLVQNTHNNNYLIVIGNASILIAMTGYLLTGNIEISLVLKAVVTLFTILIHILMYCMYGQRVTDQTMDLMENLYDSPWYDCDEKFKKSLLIMMSVAHKPLELKSTFLKHPLTLQTFNDVLRAGYSFLNLIRQM